MDKVTETDLDPKLEQRWARVRSRLEDHVEDLLTQGVLVPKLAGARRVWVVRFIERRNGTKTHKSIYICGDDRPALILRTRRLLDEFRTLGSLPEQIGADARLAAKLNTLARRLTVRRP